MGVPVVGTPIDIAVSGLRAQATRMNVIGNNIANANTTRAADGKPYRRQEVMLATGAGLAGVKVDQIVNDNSEFTRVYEPTNPQAGSDGYLLTPNVSLPVEMMNLVAANRAYQANAAVLKRYIEAAEITTELLK